MHGQRKRQYIELLLFKKKKNPELERKMVKCIYSETITVWQKTPQWRTGHNSKCSTDNWGFRAKEQGVGKLFPEYMGWGSILDKQT